jgi:hypothetical protein
MPFPKPQLYRFLPACWQAHDDRLAIWYAENPKWWNPNSRLLLLTSNSSEDWHLHFYLGHILPESYPQPLMDQRHKAVPLNQGCENPGRHIAMICVFYTLAPNMFGSSVWELLLFTLLAPRILRCLLDFGKICAPFH